MPDPTVHIVDDDAAVRGSLAFLVATAGLSVRLYASGRSLLDQLPGIAPGCLVTDVRMPEIDGVELLRRVRAARAPLAAVVITGHADVALAVQAMKEGAVDFLEKPFGDGALMDAIQSALASPPIGSRVDHPSGPAALACLSPRERQVLEGVMAGKPNKLIAHELNLSPRTVEVYRANVMSKTGATNLPDLVRLALGGGTGPA